MNSKIIRTTLLVFILFPLLSYSQKCEELIRYRDNELYNDYSKAVSKYTLNQDAKKDIQRIRQEFLGERSGGIYTSETAASNAGLTLGLTAQGIKTLSSFIINLAKFVPTTSVTANGIEYIQYLNTPQADRIYKLLDNGKTIKDAVIEGIEITVYKKGLSKIHPLGQAAKTAWEFADGISKMKEMPVDHNALKKEVKRILDMFEKELDKYETAINSSDAKLQEINEIKKGIDLYLLEKCNGKEQVKETANKKTLANVEQPVKQKVPTANSIYVFFTADITSNQSLSELEILTIISQPVLYNGNNGEMMSEKEAFFKQVAQYLGQTGVQGDKCEKIKSQLAANNYEGLKVCYNYLGDNQRKAVRTKQECLQQIEKYKSFTIAANEAVEEVKQRFVNL